VASFVHDMASSDDFDAAYQKSLGKVAQSVIWFGRGAFFNGGFVFSPQYVVARCTSV